MEADKIIYIVLFTIISLILFYKTVKILPVTYSHRFITGYYSFQFIAILIYLLNDPNARTYSSLNKSLTLQEGLIKYLPVLLVAQIAVLISTVAFSLYFPKAKKGASLTNLILNNRENLQPVCFFFALIFILYPIAGFTGQIGYIIRMLFNYFFFIPFIPGVLHKKGSSTTNIWIATLAFLFTIAMLTGSRGTAIMPCVCYIAGYFLSETPKSRKKTVGILMAIFLPLFMSFFAFVGSFRHVVGRTPFNQLTFEKVSTYYEAYKRNVYKKKYKKINSSDKDLQGVGRMVNQVNTTIVNNVPEKKPHIGFDNFGNEMRYTFDISFFSKTTVKERIKAKTTNFILNEYGYLVTEFSSVEYSLLTEGWLRFGILGVILGHLLITFFLISCEYFFRTVFKKREVLVTLVLIGLILTGYNCYAYTHLIGIRTAIMFIVVTLIIYLVIYSTPLSKVK